MDNLTAKVDEYFDNHLDRTEWLTFSDAERNAAVAMAERQVICELGIKEINIENIFQYCALSEQALFLALNRKRRVPEECNGIMVVAESVEGAGSKHYAASEHAAATGDAPGDIWSTRALLYLARAKTATTAILRG